MYFEYRTNFNKNFSTHVKCFQKLSANNGIKIYITLEEL